jgi:hypothetical protein
MALAWFAAAHPQPFLIQSDLREASVQCILAPNGTLRDKDAYDRRFGF